MSALSRSSSYQRLPSVSLDADEETGFAASLGSPDKGHSLLSAPLARPPLPPGAPGRGSNPWHTGHNRWRGLRSLRSWRFRLTTATLCKLLAGMVAALVVFHAASCGFFFCYRIPGPLEMQFQPSVSAYDEIRRIYSLRGGPHVIAGLQPLHGSVGGSGGAAGSPEEAPKLIPAIIHQTYKSANVPQAVRPLMQSWRRLNPGWEIRFYDDEACIDFVSREFPEYLAAYRALPKHVERSDFFRYMVVLRLGGVYADLDTESRRPLNELIAPRDTLVVGWENEFDRPQEAERRHYIRNRQVLQWVFAGAPGHPALREICDHINRHATTVFSNNTNRDTLERTGPGVWTDVVLKHALSHPPSNRDDPWTVKLLPKVHWGAHPAGLDNLYPDDQRIAVMHHYLGSWKVKGGWRKRRISIAAGLQAVTNLIRHRSSSQAYSGVDRMPEPTASLYPVSVDWQPPFSVLVPLKGSGDRQAGDDVAATITAWGSWQPALEPHRRPSVGEALVGSLGGRRADQQVLLDIGAGQGLFSLAAAARGHRVIALEASPRSLEPFEASVAFNGFGKLWTLHRAPAGAVDGQPVCLERGGAHATALARGYSTAEASDPAAGGECTRTGMRRAAASLVPPDTDVAAIRISAPGWEHAVLQGLQPLIEGKPPSVVLVELHPAKLGSGGGGTAVQLLQRMADWGYTDVSHSGRVCDERWLNITKSIRSRGAMGLAGREALKQPTWCRLQPDGWATLAARVSVDVPENLLFIAKPAPPSAPAKDSNGSGSSKSSAAQHARRSGGAPGTEALASAGGPDVAVGSGSSPSLSDERLPA